MTSYILNFFVGKNLDYNNKFVRQKIGIISNIIGICLNIILFLIKFLIGLFSNSISIMSDSINNLNDSISSIVSLLGFKFSSKDADNDHPFGHGRAEYISAFVISFIIMWFGLEFFRISFTKVLNPEPITLKFNMFIFLLITIVVKLWLGFFNLNIGRKINSNALLATARDSFSDVLVTLSTIFSALVTIYTGYIIDGYVGIFVSILIFVSGFTVAKEALSTLIGEAASPEIGKKISEMILQEDEVIGVHNLIVHNYGNQNYLATIHIELPSSLNIEESHNLVDRIEKNILSTLNIHLTTHIDPVDLENEELLKIKPIIETYVKSINQNFSAHDVRIISTRYENKILFDMSVPVGFKGSEIRTVQQNAVKFLEQLYPDYECIVYTHKNYSPHI